MSSLLELQRYRQGELSCTVLAFSAQPRCPLLTRADLIAASRSQPVDLGQNTEHWSVGSAM